MIVNGSRDGIVVESGAGNVVRGNLIGTDADGNKARNQRYGVLVTGTADQTRVEANFIGYNDVAGIGIDAAGDVDVIGDFVGLGQQTLNGAKVFVPMGNGTAGIYVTGQFAGRDVHLTGNVVVLSDANGITLDAAAGIHVTGNKIGTDPAGNYADGQFGNFGDAVHIDHGSTGNVIGGTAPGDGNVITGSVGDNMPHHGFPPATSSPATRSRKTSAPASPSAAARATRSPTATPSTPTSASPST